MKKKHVNSIINWQYHSWVSIPQRAVNHLWNNKAHEAKHGKEAT